MKVNEQLIRYPGGESAGGYHIRTYDSLVEFDHRPAFGHKHSDFEISLICAGGGIYDLNGRVCEIGQGDVFVFGSNQIHCITDVFPGERMLLFNVQFESRMIWSPISNLLNERYLRLFNGKCEKIGQDAPYGDRIRSLMRELRDETFTRAPGYQIRINALLLSVIGELVRDCDIPFDDTKTGAKNQTLLCMDRAMDYINARLDRELTLGEIAANAGFSRTYFTTLFTDLNGLSPWDYITIRRIERGKQLLLGTDLPVIEVSLRCGYANLSNFNRQFRRLVGCSPSEFRKK